jgi:hypothetical protein
MSTEAVYGYEEEAPFDELEEVEDRYRVIEK